MVEIHPNVRIALELNRELGNRIAEMGERVDRIVARRPSPSGLVIPEVDARGRLTDLYLAPGTCDRFDSGQLSAEIMAAIVESTEDARRQHDNAMNDPANLPRPLEEIVREWQAGATPDQPLPVFGKREG